MPATYTWELTHPGHAIVVTVTTSGVTPSRETEPGRGGVGIGAVNPFEAFGAKPHLAGMMKREEQRKPIGMKEYDFRYTITYPHVINIETIRNYRDIGQLAQVELIIMAMAGYEYVMGRWKQQVTVPPPPINYYTVAAATEYRYHFVPSPAVVLSALNALGFRRAGASRFSTALQQYELTGPPALPEKAGKGYPSSFRF